jgi:alpha-tubulin suppressor-like RCC1 family protein
LDNTNKPTNIEFLNNIVINDISCGQHHCNAISNDNKIYSFGLNKQFQLGIFIIINNRRFKYKRHLFYTFFKSRIFKYKRYFNDKIWV